jgi:hypothetical protein
MIWRNEEGNVPPKDPTPDHGIKYQAAKKRKTVLQPNRSKPTELFALSATQIVSRESSRWLDPLDADG